MTGWVYPISEWLTSGDKEEFLWLYDEDKGIFEIMVKEKTDGWKFCLVDMDDIQLYRAVTKKD
jgi:hypothetical protein